MSGIAIKLNCGPIFWKSTRQPVIALLIFAAETISGCEAVKELIFIRLQLLEIEYIKFERSIPVYIDNQSTVVERRTVKAVTSEPTPKRSKHIHIQKQWLHEQQKKGIIDIKHIPGSDQQADILTKPMPQVKFVTMRDLLMSTILLVSWCMLTCTLATSTPLTV